MGALELSGDRLSVRMGGRHFADTALEELRLVYLIAPVNERWFVLAGGHDLLAVDLDDEEQQEGLDLFRSLFRESRPRDLAGLDVCLADYSGQRTVVPLKAFRKAGIDFFDRLDDTRPGRIARRREWLVAGPTVVMKGRFGSAKLNRTGFSLSARKSLQWSEVGKVQIDRQESLITTTHLLVIPEGVGDGLFSMKKYRYSLKSIPNRKANAYLAECLFWMNDAEVVANSDLEKDAMEELVRDGILPGV